METKTKLIWILAVLVCGDILTTTLGVINYGVGVEAIPQTRLLMEALGLGGAMAVLGGVSVICLLIVHITPMSDLVLFGLLGSIAVRAFVVVLNASQLIGV